MDTALEVPTIDVRKRISYEVIAHVAHQIAERFNPKKIILFGSYAYGSPRPESDIDLLVVMETAMRPSEQVQRIREYLDPLFGLDLMIYTPEILAKRLEWGDAFLREIITKGKDLYESPDS